MKKNFVINEQIVIDAMFDGLEVPSPEQLRVLRNETIVYYYGSFCMRLQEDNSNYRMISKLDMPQSYKDAMLDDVNRIKAIVNALCSEVIRRCEGAK